MTQDEAQRSRWPFYEAVNFELKLSYRLNLNSVKWFFSQEKRITFQSFYHMLSAWWHSDTGCGVFSLQREDNPLKVTI